MPLLSPRPKRYNIPTNKEKIAKQLKQLNKNIKKLTKALNSK